MKNAKPTRSLKIFLLRHGEDEDNRDKVFNGQRNTLLTPRGIIQVTNLAHRIKKEKVEFVAVYSSPLTRALDTATIISDIAGQPTPQIFDELIERNVGTLTGMKVIDAEKSYMGDIFTLGDKPYFLNPEGGETFADLRNRAEEMLRTLKSLHPEGNILLVSHRMLLTMVYGVFHNLSWQEAFQTCKLENADLVLLEDTAR